MSLSKFVESARLLISKLSIRTILPLVGARAVYRVGMALSSVILIVEWGKDEFAGYALAIGTFVSCRSSPPWVWRSRHSSSFHEPATPPGS